MTKSDRIRELIASGATNAEIAAAMPDTTLRYVQQTRWRMRNPRYQAMWTQFWRACNPDTERARIQRRQVQNLIRAERAHQARKAGRVQRIVGPAHWYDGEL